MKNLATILFLCICLTDTYAQLGIKANNTPPIASAQLEVQSTTKAFYPPRMTTVQKNAIASPQAGAVVYDTDLSGLYYYNGTAWKQGMTLPYSSSQNLPNGNLLTIENTSNTVINSTITGITNGVIYSAGVLGVANNPDATSTTAGVRGYNRSDNSSGSGVYGEHNGGGQGVYGKSSFGTGGFFTSSSSYALTTGDGNVGINTDTPAEQLTVKTPTSNYGVTHTNGTVTVGTFIDTYGGWFGTKTNHPLFFRTNNNVSAQVALLVNGNFGIGTSSPSALLHLKAQEDTWNKHIRLEDDNTTEYASIIYDNADALKFRNNQSGYGFSFRNAANSNVLTISSAGNVVAGGTLTAGAVCVAGGLTCISDFRYKKNFKPIENSLANILKINGLRYDWRREEFPEKQFSDKNQIGFIAQDLEKIYPEMVFTDAQGYKSVDYSRLTPVLVEAIKEQQKQIEALKISVQESENFKNRIEKLEALLLKTDEEKSVGKK